MRNKKDNLATPSNTDRSRQNLVAWSDEGYNKNPFQDLLETVGSEIQGNLTNDSYKVSKETLAKGGMNPNNEGINLVDSLEDGPTYSQTNSKINNQQNISGSTGVCGAVPGEFTNNNQTAYQMNPPKHIPTSEDDFIKVSSKSIDKLADAQYSKSVETAYLIKCNDQLHARVDDLSKKNAAKEEKIQELRKKLESPVKAEVGIWNNQLIYCRKGGDNKVIPICEYPFDHVYRMIDYTDGLNESYIVIEYLERESGMSVIKENSLYKPGLLSEIKHGARQNISVDGVPDTKLSYALAEFLQHEADKLVPILLFSKAGWEFQQEKFYTLSDYEDIFSEIKKLHPQLPVLKRTLKQGWKPSDKGFALMGQRNILYQIAVYGSVLMSLLQKNGADAGFAIWIPNDLRGKKFVRQFFSVWADYQAQFDIAQKKEMRQTVQEAKDEPIIISVSDGREHDRKKLSELLENFFAGMPCIENARLEGLPIIMSENYFRVCEYLEEPHRIIPLIPNNMEAISSQASSADFIPPFIEWCERNYSLVEGVVRLVVHGDELFSGNHDSEERGVPEETIFLGNRISGIARTFCAVWLVITAYRENYDNIGISSVIERHFTEASEEVTALLCAIQKFCGQSSLAMFQQWLKECVENDILSIKNNNEVQETELNKVVVYGRKGEVYFSDNAFKIVLNRGEMYDTSFMLTALAAEGAIQTEAKGNGSVTYKPHCSVPAGCGNQQKRLIKFLAGMLMDEEGAEFGGELL